MKPYEPDFGQLRKVLDKGPSDYPIPFEFYMDGRVVCPDEPGPRADLDEHLRLVEYGVRCFRRAHMHHASVRAHEYGLEFPYSHAHEARERGQQTISLNDRAMIAEPSDVASYPWPDVEAVDYGVLERVAPFLPGNMRLLADAPMGVLELTIRLMGYENMCVSLIEDPAFFKDVSSRIGKILFDHYARAVAYPSVQGLMLNDDWGFNTQTMISPADLRRYVIPWHRVYARLAHERGKVAVMHSCGQLERVYEDIIEDIGIDGKHSYEDAITPVEDMYEAYKGRMAILGGMDINYLCTAAPETIYRRCRAMIDRARADGGYALGSGNSIPSYIPIASWQAMQRAVLDG